MQPPNGKRCRANHLKLYSSGVNSQSRRVIESSSRVQPAPSSLATRQTTDFARNLETALARAQENLLRLQKPEGYWIGELMVDSTIVSDTIAYHHWHGKVDKEWQRKAVNTFCPCSCRMAAGTFITAARRR